MKNLLLLNETHSLGKTETASFAKATPCPRRRGTSNEAGLSNKTALMSEMVK